MTTVVCCALRHIRHSPRFVMRRSLTAESGEKEPRMPLDRARAERDKERPRNRDGGEHAHENANAKRQRESPDDARPEPVENASGDQTRYVRVANGSPRAVEPLHDGLPQD